MIDDGGVCRLAVPPHGSNAPAFRAGLTHPFLTLAP